MKVWGKYWSGFTLIEMIIVITVLWIIFLSVNTFDFSRVSERQKHEILVNVIIWHIQTVRNYAFQGKWIGINLDIPSQWTVEISNTSSWTLLTQYSGTTSGIYSPTSLIAKKWEEIKDLRCLNLDRSTVENISGTVTLTMKGDNISIAGCSDPSLKILEMTISYRDYSSIIEVNTINSIIQKR